MAAQWLRGFTSLAFDQAREWNENVAGVTYYKGAPCPQSEVCKDITDGLLTEYTQAPSFFQVTGDIYDRTIEARNANHLEETAHPSVETILSDIFENENVPDTGGGGGGGDDPVDPIDPCDDGQNQMICN